MLAPELFKALSQFFHIIEAAAVSCSHHCLGPPPSADASKFSMHSVTHAHRKLTDINGSANVISDCRTLGSAKAFWGNALALSVDLGL